MLQTDHGPTVESTPLKNCYSLNHEGGFIALFNSFLQINCYLSEYFVETLHQIKARRSSTAVNGNIWENLNFEK